MYSLCGGVEFGESDPAAPSVGQDGHSAEPELLFSISYTPLANFKRKGSKKPSANASSNSIAECLTRIQVVQIASVSPSVIANSTTLPRGTFLVGFVNAPSALSPQLRGLM